MKKLILTAAILLGSISAFALTSNNEINETCNFIKVSEEFTEVGVDELPDAIISAVKNDYASSIITKAYVNNSKQYKLLITVDGNLETVYADEEGNWLEESNIKTEEE